MPTRNRVLNSRAALVLWLLSPVFGQSTEPAGEASTEALQKAVQNPVADLISLPFQNNTFLQIGPYERNRNQLNIQPIIPFHLGKVNLITRVILPVENMPRINQQSGHIFGFGDTLASFFISPAKPGKMIWGLGPSGLIPTATRPELGQGKTTLGPAGTLLAQPGRWTIGFFGSQFWSIAGPAGRPDINFFFGQYYLTYNLPQGWYVTSNPIFTMNWKQPGGDRLTLPFGGGVGRIFRVGGQPFNALASYFYYAVRPDNVPSPKQEVRLQITILLPKSR